MKIMTLQGTDKLLYELVAPLVMNPAILRQNNNYPFKTSRSHVWPFMKQLLLVLCL